MLLIVPDRSWSCWAEAPQSPGAVQPANSLGGAKGRAVIAARLLGAAQLSHPRTQSGICQGHRARMVHGWVREPLLGRSALCSGAAWNSQHAWQIWGTATVPVSIKGFGTLNRSCLSPCFQPQ